MAQETKNPYHSEMIRAVSNTGPLISAFQSSSYPLLTLLFREIHISTICVAELAKHGWEKEVEAAAPHVVTITLGLAEEEDARNIALQIARHPETKDSIPENHLGEAQVIVLAQRSEYRNDALLLDELAARAIAKQKGLNLSGFAGVLLLAVRAGLLSADELKVRLEKCKTLGTHYSASFIQQMYDAAKQEGAKREN